MASEVDYLEVKKKIIESCQASIRKRISEATDAILQLRSSAAEETKSSAGDKYETAREMISQEIEKQELQLADARNQLSVLATLDISVRQIALPGTVVETEHGAFFISTSAPAISLPNGKFVPVSPQSPLGSKLTGRKAGDTVVVNQRSFKVISVY